MAPFFSFREQRGFSEEGGLGDDPFKVVFFISENREGLRRRRRRRKKDSIVNSLALSSVALHFGGLVTIG